MVGRPTLVFLNWNPPNKSSPNDIQYRKQSPHFGDDVYRPKCSRSIDYLCLVKIECGLVDSATDQRRLNLKFDQQLTRPAAASALVRDAVSVTTFSRRRAGI